MRRLSDEFAINDADAPTMFLNGRQGYCLLNRPGAYVIRAVFRASSEWRLFDGQESDVYSSVIVVRIRD